MFKSLLAVFALFALAGAARADVVLATKLSGTGDNVVFNSLSGTQALGALNDPKSHNDVVRFDNLGPTVFSAAADGNDIKITGTNDLEVQVFDSTNTNVVGTVEQVFSLTGDGTVKLFVQASDKFGVAEALKTFTLDPLKNGQNGFTLTASNGEVMTSLIIFDTNGNISDFEHYRIDVAPLTSAVPEASTWAMMLLGFAGVGLLGLRRRRGGQAFRLA
jgi:hypothetical protein